ncbi:hypothetical protein FRB99_005259 [Tulasnella sp. 403]|nr:hypothetical protein FRB99_005259 [Tulasnella sp. 403]
MSLSVDGEPQSTALGGTASQIQVHKIGYGLMMMTWTPTPTPDEQAFEALRTAISLVPADHKLLINSGEFYGINPRTANLELVARFFTKHPELAERCFLSVKGGTSAQDLEPDASPENIRRSVDTILKALDGKKKLDLFQCARIDPKVPVEDTMTTLLQLQSEGKFDHIGISEVSEATLKRAASVAGIAAVEIEVSPWAYEEETRKVIETAQELDIAVVAYAPLGRGFLTGQLKKEDLPEGDFRRNLAKFQETAAAHNHKLVEALGNIAQKKGVSNAQLCIAWVSTLGANVIPLPGSSKPSRVKENFAAGNIKFTEEELTELNQVIADTPVVGGRYFGGENEKTQQHLWG